MFALFYSISLFDRNTRTPLLKFACFIKYIFQQIILTKFGISRYVSLTTILIVGYNKVTGETQNYL